MISYRNDITPDAQLIADLYRAAPLIRPVDDVDRIRRMYEGSNLVITAWDEHLLVGISRSRSDFSHFSYLADLAVRVSHQKQGIGKELIRLTQVEGGPNTTILLLAAPAAEKYYPRLGFSQARQAWLLNGGERLR